MTCTNCSAGYMCGLAATSPTQTQCPPGTYSEGGASVCSLCPGGKFGNSSGLTSSACTGPCPAGYVCGPGTVNGTATLCPLGQFSGEGSSVCSPCPGGRYGSVPPLVHASCTGLCVVGRWGAPGTTSPDCTGPCAAGYACPPGLNTSNPGSSYECVAGRYSARGQGVCSPCPKGRYGNTAGAVSSDCTGACVVGHYCPEGSTEQIPYVAFFLSECAGCSSTCVSTGPTTGCVAVLEIEVVPSLPLHLPPVRCPPGAYAAIPSASECTLCPINSFADTERSQACTPCGDIGDNLLTLGGGSTSASDCVCSAGFYSVGAVARQTQQPCLACDKRTMGCQNSPSKWHLTHAGHCGGLLGITVVPGPRDPSPMHPSPC
jgi:hypothetical protein